MTDQDRRCRDSEDAAGLAFLLLVVALVLGLILSVVDARAADSQPPAPVEEHSILADPDTFAVCKTVDVVTTVVGVTSGRLVEANGIVRAMGLPAFALLSVWLIWYFQKTDADATVANVVTCPVAAHNLLLLGGL